MDEHIEAVQRMQDYIESHFMENITMADLARVSMYSPWYSYRLFQQYLDMTPFVYIRRLRLSKSALRLRDESVKILDVALDVGFGSVDGYQRAFIVNLAVILMSIQFVLCQFICLSLMESNIRR